MKKIVSFFKSLDSIIIFFGMLSNFGIVVVSAVFLDIFYNIFQTNLENFFIPLFFIHIIFSIGIFFAIGKSKSFKIGYIIGFALIMLFLIKRILSF